MSDLLLKTRHPLADVQTGRLGVADPATPGITLVAPVGGTVLQLLAAPTKPLTSSNLKKKIATPGLALREAGPNQWLLVGEKTLAPADLSTLEKKLTKTAAVVDQSQGRVRLQVSGSAVNDLLAKGIGLDFGDDAFPVGKSAQALYGHVSLHLTRTESNSFELLVFRGFAESLWEQLIEMSLEFGLQAEVQTT